VSQKKHKHKCLWGSCAKKLYFINTSAYGVLAVIWKLDWVCI